MGWLNEGIESFRDLCKRGIEPKAVDLPGVDDNYFTIGGEVHTVPKDNHRLHHVTDLSSMVSAIQRWSDAGTVWVDCCGVLFLCDDSSTARKNRVGWSLHKTPQYAALLELEDEPQMNQRELIWWLRHTMAGCVDDTVLSSVRSVDVTREDNKASTIEHGKESMGRAIKAEVAGSGNLPETLQVDFQCYQNWGSDTTVLCTMMFDLDSENFKIAPLPGELDKAADMHLNRLQHQLMDEIERAGIEGVTVFRGTP